MLPISQIGRLVNDLTLKYVPIEDGEPRAVINNRLAITVNTEESVFIDITAWGKTAELIMKHYKKGDEILVTGKLKCKKYKVDEEKSIDVHYLLIEHITFTYGKKQSKES